MSETPQNPTPVGEVDFSVEDDIDSSNQKSYSQGRLVFRRLLRHRAAMISAIVLILIVMTLNLIGRLIAER